VKGDPLLLITLYVPDRVMGQINGRNHPAAALMTGVDGLGFVAPGWWEDAYTARLNPLPEAAEAAEVSNDPNLEAKDIL
jgi:hypothetical protein